MINEYDFYKCKNDFQKKGVPLPEDINAPVIELLTKVKCESAIPDILNIQKYGNFGQYKVVNKNKPNIIYVFKFQCGMIINWDIVTGLERDGLISEVTNSYKNKFINIEKRKPQNDRSRSVAANT